MCVRVNEIFINEEGREYILELNSSAIGLNGRHAAEDAQYIRYFSHCLYFMVFLTTEKKYQKK